MSAIKPLIKNAFDSLSPQLDLYAGSVWEPVLKESSRRRGKFGENLSIQIYDQMLKRELPRLRSLAKHTKNSESDMDVLDTLIEVKTSKLWYTPNGDHHFKFQQIRDQQYSYAFLLGYLPDGDLMCWLVPKRVIRANSVGQHGGMNSDVKWSANISPDDIPNWMKPYGGLWPASSMREPPKALRLKLLVPFESKIQMIKSINSKRIIEPTYRSRVA